MLRTGPGKQHHRYHYWNHVTEEENDTTKASGLPNNLQRGSDWDSDAALSNSTAKI